MTTKAPLLKLELFISDLLVDFDYAMDRARQELLTELEEYVIVDDKVLSEIIWEVHDVIDLAAKRVVLIW